MKPVHRTGSASCSCTSCLYKSESEQPSIRKYIAHGSKIDRLYFGKYIPLRERKLLNRLVRTRAVYDDLRARLISDSTLSLDKNADLRPRKHHHAIKTLNSKEKSGAILELVDIIDKGAVANPKKLSECCSCCSCSSKTKIFESDKREHRYKRSYSQRFETKHGRRAQYGRKAQYSHRAHHGQRKHGRGGERYKRGVRFRGKHIRSDPCICTFKFSDLIKKHSKAMMRKIHPPPPISIRTLEDREMMRGSKLHKFAGLSSQKYKELQEKLKEDMKKLNESVANMKENVQVRTKKSIEQMKQAKYKLKTNIESGVRKSLEAVKGLQRKHKAFEYLEYPEDVTNFAIKKDSIVKFKDYLKRKQIMKDWACDLECVPDTCEPEECFRILKLRRSHKRKMQRDRKDAFNYETLNREVNIGEVPIRKSSSSVQSEQFATTIATHTRKQKPILRVEGGNDIMGQRVIFETKEVRKEIRHGAKKGGKGKTNVQQIVVEKSDESLPIATGGERNVKNKQEIRRKGGVKGREQFWKKDRSDALNRQAVRMGSSFGIDIEMQKNVPESETSNRSNQPSGIHFTGKKVTQRAHKAKHKKTQGHHKAAQVIPKPKIPIAKRVSSIKTNTPHGTKSVSSITKNPVLSPDRNLAVGVKKEEQEAHPISATHGSSHKQAVRIESKFTFSVEFYKKDHEVEGYDQKDDEVEVPSVKEKGKHTRNVRSYVPPKVFKNQGSLAKAKYMHAKSTLERCMCTLKLNKFKKLNKRIKTSTTGTVTSLVTKIPPAMLDKHVETKKRFDLPKTYELLPYECEPGICVPGECDPILCKKLLDQRNYKLRTYDRGSYTSSRLTKSASSIVSKPIAVKTKNVQSSVISTKIVKTSAPRRYKEPLSLDKPKDIHPERQAVRIGSSFSFNIEFYKDKAIPTAENEEDISNVSRLAEVKYKQPKLKDAGYPEYNKNNKSMFAHITKKDQNIGPSLKRCFCTLKLYKNKNIKKKIKKRDRMLTAVTQTFDEMVPVTETVDRGTKTKWRHNYELLPYECEPYFCVPGECDPYVCLQRIKKRQVNVRDYGVFTGNPKMSSISSLTENSYTRSTGILAHPKLFRKGTNVNENYRNTLDYRPQEPIALGGGAGEAYGSINSKQAVRIGSSFNFSIEFSKQLPKAYILTKEPKREKMFKVKQKRHKGNKVTNIHVDHVDVDTQSLEPRKVHRAALVRPILKRCFCTLNLQKKAKRQYRKGQTGWAPGNQFIAPKMYAVTRAMTTKSGIQSHHNFGSQDAKLQVIECNKKISISTSSFLYKKYVTTSVSKYNTLKLFPVLELPLRLKQPITLNSNLSVEIEFIRELKLNKKCALDNNIKPPLKSFSSVYINEKPLENINVFSQPSLQNPKIITGVSQYLERCYCTMNVKISHTRVPTERKKNNYKLKPYECEPGICVPGECNPYECQKLIKRRLMRNMHKGSGTQSDTKSISSFTSQTGSDSRSTQLGRHIRSHSQETKPDKHKIKYNRDTKHKQAVRIGSTFSFDVEFSRNASQPPTKGYRENRRIKYYKEPARRIYSTRSKGAQGRRVRYGKDSQLQSTSTLVHRGSNYTPRIKRCFCTLKLQKKGRIHRRNEKNKDLPKEPMEPPHVSSRNVKIGTRNIKHQHIPIRHLYNNLEPYECEPGICIPGECNPYECLERMKNRKDFGVSTAEHGERSISSMTSDGRYYARKKLQTHGIDVRHKGTHKKYRRRGEDINSISSSVSGRRSRQAVRIGSNFSFNIEFYKGTPQAHLKDVDNEDKSTRSYKSDLRESRPRKHIKGSLSQSSRNVSHRETQIETPTNQMQTMTTSFIKRCFCTAKLQGIQISNEQNTPTFMQRCFCLLGLRQKRKNDNQRTEIPSKTANKRTNTIYRHKVRMPLLEPYECEPGICVPGECNPYVCDKIIQQRLAKQYSKSSGTESARTQSVSSSFGYNKRHKDRTTQARGKKYNKRTLNKFEDRRLGRKFTNNENKRLVRIGSNFSFNVEFFKENAEGSTTKDEARVSQAYSSRTEPYKVRDKVKRLKSTGTVGPSIRSTESQSDKKGVRTFGVNPLLKRCFCTLKLLKRPIDQAQNMNKINTNPVLMKTAETQSNKILGNAPLGNNIRGDGLLPYECEPYVCIPGECNPLECLERIKRRNQNTKDFGTFTGYAHKKSVGSVATTTTKDEYLQAKNKGSKPNKTTQKTHYVDKHWQPKSGNLSRQAVRIGSNFSFNIEFSKGNGNDDPELVPSLSREYVNVRKYPKNSTKRHMKSQPSYFGRSVDTQASTKFQSTDTGTSHLNRCFCTLQLQNKNDNKLIKPKSEHSAVGEFLKKCMCAFKINKVGKLQQKPPTPAVKYEIKGTSTYSQSPRQSIKPITILEPYECEPNFCIPGECNPYECLKRIQKRKVRDFGTEYKRNVRHFATDSIQMPLTKNTEAQFYRKQRLHSQGTSFPSKRRRSDDTSQYSSQINRTDKSNKQAVRIGSNFSFNIEFFKENGDQPLNEYTEFKAGKIPNIKTRSEKLPPRSRGSDSIGTKLRCRSSQCPFLKKHAMSAAVNNMPKKCFCTLNLLKKPNNLKPNFQSPPPIAPLVTTDNKMTATKNKYFIPHELGVYECPPNMCIPGECDPYDCLEKMKRRGRKFRNVGTRPGKTSVASVGNRSSKIKAHGNQSIIRKRNIVAYTPHSEPQSLILKSPQMAQNMDRQNKRAVRIGSNFNFSIDFFKQKSHPAVIRSQKIVRARDKDEDFKSYINKNVPANAGKFRHHDSQVGSTVTRDQGSDAGNLLKRCFCTLQLQKSSRQRKMLHNKVVPGINAQYPQTITVGRVSVEPFNKKIRKSQRVSTQNQASQIRQSRSTDPKMITNLRTVATKIDKKHIKNNTFLQSVCDPTSCLNYQKKNSLRKRIRNDMHTILPYTPSKFNKRESKTLVSNRDKLKKIRHQNHLQLENDNKLQDISAYDKGKTLTAKKSKKSIPPNKLDTKGYLNNSIFCRCARIFSKRSRAEFKAHKNHENIDNFYNDQFKIVVKPKRLKSNKVPKPSADEVCPVACRKITDGSKGIYSKFQSGDGESITLKEKSTKNEKLPNIQSKSVERKSITKNQKMKVTFADTTKYPVAKEKKKKSLHQSHGSKEVSKLCYSCSVNNCPLLSENVKTDKEKGGVFHKFTNRLSKTYDKPITYSESADNCHYCQLCKKKLEVDEISKGAGDRDFADKTEKKSLSKKKKHPVNTDKRKSVSSQRKKRPCPCGTDNPLLEMRVDAENYDIINKREVRQRVRDERVRDERVNNTVQDVQEPLSYNKYFRSLNEQWNFKTRLTEGAKILVPAKGITKNIFSPGKTLVKKDQVKIDAPCICGSLKCAVESNRTKIRSKSREHKPCVCGSDICARETKKIKKLRSRYVCTCRDEMDRRRALKKVYDKMDVQRRVQIEREKDRIRRLKRIKRNAELEKKVKKYKDSSDTFLAVESLIDVGKMGLSTICDAAGMAAKAIYDPKVAIERMKCKRADPQTRYQEFEKAYMESDAAALAKRLKLRCMFMKTVQETRQKLEENPITHFILHVADKNAKTRKFKRKPVRRRREPLDFECSLYMASLRKRPCLSIYYKWPWFYPHLVTMLNIWKQFTDVSLFLLAAVVWSPCILCMEGCRALMCCVFCTG